jgi:hypothetical protein
MHLSQKRQPVVCLSRGGPKRQTLEASLTCSPSSSLQQQIPNPTLVTPPSTLSVVHEFDVTQLHVVLREGKCLLDSDDGMILSVTRTEVVVRV